MSIIPAKQWAKVSQDSGSTARLKEIPIPSPKRDEILINIKYSGSCHSYLHLWAGDYSTSSAKDHVDGHEGVGVVTAIGNEVKNINIGDHVGVQWLNRTCGECEPCKTGSYLHCPAVAFTGLSVGGTLSEYCTCQERHAILIPRHYPLESVLHILCAGLIAYKAIKDSGVAPGQTVAIADAHTGLGDLACQYAKAYGLRVIALVEGCERSNHLKRHTDHLIDCKSTEDIVSSVKNVTSGGPDAAIVLASGGASLQSARQFVKASGTVVLVGLRPGGSMEADFSKALSRMVNIKSSFGGSKQDTEDALNIFVEKEFQITPQVLPLDRLDRILHNMKQGRTTFNTPEKRERRPTINQSIDHESRQRSIPTYQTDNNYNVGTFLANRMQELGVKDFFAVPGDSNLSLLDNLLKNPHLRMVSCCNELNTGYTADGYARTSKSKIAFVVIPYIVGGLSIINAISGAHSEHLKVVVISGCPNTDMLTGDKFLHHTPSRTNKDQALRAFQGVAASSVRVDSPETAIDVIDGALLKCLDKSLPVYIEVANDMVTAPCLVPSPLQRNVDFARQERETSHAIESIKKAWNSAKRPILLVGPLARLASSKDDVQLLAEKLGCAILCQPDSRWIPESHPQSCGVFWPGVSNIEGDEIVMNSDLWVVLGGCWSDLHVLSINTQSERHRMLDIQPEGIQLPDGTTLGPVNVESLVSGLIKSDITTNGTSIPSSRLQVSSPVPGELELSEKPLTMKSLLAGIQGILQGHHTIIADTGETWFAASRLRLPLGADCQMQLAYASIGWSLGAGLGAQIGLPDRRVIIMAGDGGFQMTAQEVSTMIRMKLNPIIFLFNNLGYKTETAVHEGPYNYIANWDYTKLAKSLYREPHAESHNPYTTEEAPRMKSPPMFAAKIQTQADLALALQRAEVESGKLAFLECCIQPGDMTAELRKLGDKVGNEMGASDSSTEAPAQTPSPTPSSDSRSTISSSVSSPVPRPKDVGNLRDLNASNLKIALTKESREVSPLESPDVLSHKVCTDHMVQARWSIDGGWDDPEIVPYGPLSFMPSASALHYSTMCFEGMKAFRGMDEKLRLFRAGLNCCRLLDSATRVCLPSFSPRDLHVLIKKLCEIDAPKWLPPSQKGSSLYIRPTFIGTSEGLGLNRPKEALLYVIVSFWPNSTVSASQSITPSNGLRLWTSPRNMTRSWPGGYGSAKLAANYGPSLLAQQKAQAAGYDQVMWLFGPDRQVTEAGASNLFFIWRSLQGTLQGRLQLVTAPLEDNLILPGVTRRSVLELARSRMSIEQCSIGNTAHCVEPVEVAEKKFTIHDVIDAADQGRLRGAFVTGTACFITPVTSIYFEGREIDIEPDATPHIALFRKWMSNIVNGEEHSSWTEVVEG